MQVAEFVNIMYIVRVTERFSTMKSHKTPRIICTFVFISLLTLSSSSTSFRVLAFLDTGQACANATYGDTGGDAYGRWHRPGVGNDSIEVEFSTIMLCQTNGQLNVSTLESVLNKTDDILGKLFSNMRYQKIQM